MSAVVGCVARVIRYPVKSMAGEDVSRTEVTARGVAGDRGYALIDRETGRVVSAKRPRTWGSILEHAARFERPPGPGGTLPDAVVTFPDGSEVTTRDADGLDAALSVSLGREVSLEGAAPEGASFEYHWPDMEGLLYRGRYYRDEITMHRTPAGTFFDSSSLLLLTTASIEEIARLAPDSEFDVRRFRPNLVVETAPGIAGFAENDWVGRDLRIGTHLRVHVTKPCLRCVMTTLAQDELPHDPGVLRAAFDHNAGNLGASAEVVSPGPIRVGDEVVLAGET